MDKAVEAFIGETPVLELKPDAFREVEYRPFCQQFLYFDDFWNEERYRIPQFLPTAEATKTNVLIAVSGVGSQKPFQCLALSILPTLDLLEKTQCFPFHTYDEHGANRRENITDWALEQFRVKYDDSSITKWDIFHYIYAVLHHPEYRQRYAANLRRDLPRIPFASGSSDVKAVDIFRAFVRAGQRLAEIHVNYERQSEYPLAKTEKAGEKLDWGVTKMRLSKDKTSILYNKFLTLGGIPPETYEYRLGNRSALEWIIDQYQVSTDKRSGITNDPNRSDDQQYILRLIGQVITVSLETVKIVKGLPALGLPD